MESLSNLLLENALFIIVIFLLVIDNLRVSIVLGTVNITLQHKKNIALLLGYLNPLQYYWDF
jgi:hypothetical protein